MCNHVKNTALLLDSRTGATCLSCMNARINILHLKFVSVNDAALYGASYRVYLQAMSLREEMHFNFLKAILIIPNAETKQASILNSLNY